MARRKHRRWANRVAWCCLGLAAGFGGCRATPEAAEPASAQTLQRVSVAPFRSQSSAHVRLSAALAESLAARLSRLPGLSAAVEGSSPKPDFRLGGELAVGDGRMMIAVRLYGSEGAEPVWSGTFWRKDSLDTALVTDLAEGVAEAMAGHLVRRAAAARR